MGPRDGAKSMILRVGVEPGEANDRQASAMRAEAARRIAMREERERAKRADPGGRMRAAIRSSAQVWGRRG